MVLHVWPKESLKENGKATKREGTEQCVRDICEEGFDGETNIKSLIIEIYLEYQRVRLLWAAKIPDLHLQIRVLPCSV